MEVHAGGFPKPGRAADIWLSGILALVKTTLDLPEDLYRATKAKAALEGVRVTDLIVQALRLVVQGSPAPGARVTFPLISCGKADFRVAPETIEREEAHSRQEEDAAIAPFVRR